MPLFGIIDSQLTLNCHNRYTGQAFKAANQAIGRLIRNTEDFGALILLDRRYAGETLRQMLPGWVRKANRQWHA